MQLVKVRKRLSEQKATASPGVDHGATLVKL